MTFSIFLQELDFKLLYGDVGERPDCCLQTEIGEFSITLLVDAFLMAVLSLCFSPSFALHSSLLAPLLSPKSTANSLPTLKYATNNQVCSLTLTQEHRQQLR